MLPTSGVNKIKTCFSSLERSGEGDDEGGRGCCPGCPALRDPVAGSLSQEAADRHSAVVFTFQQQGGGGTRRATPSWEGSVSEMTQTTPTDRPPLSHDHTQVQGTLRNVTITPQDSKLGFSLQASFFLCHAGCKLECKGFYIRPSKGEGNKFPLV